MSDTVKILSLRFPLLTETEALRIAARMAAAHRPFSVFTPNAEIANRAARSPAFSDLLNRADLLLPDGVGITLAARLRGARLSRMPGIDFAERLLAAAPPRGYRVFLLGARPGVAALAGRELERRFPRVRVCGVQDGYFPPGMRRAVAGAVTAASPDLLFVCLGSPLQEEWIAAFRPPCLAIGLGGALDVWAGCVRRAPDGWQRMGLEWLWRTAKDPARLRRLPALAAFAWRAVLPPVPEKPEKEKKSRAERDFSL